MPSTEVLGRLNTSEALVSLRPAYHMASHLRWAATGRRGPVPHRVKERVVRQLADSYGLGVFVETGTYLGDMVWAVRHRFREVHSVELDPELWARACRRFSAFPHVHLHHGDSGRVLGEIIEAVREPALFWLDGHFSGGITAPGEQPTPVRAELDQLLSHRRTGDVILIDDARCFTGSDGYPSMSEIRERVSRRDDLSTLVRSDMIQILPSPEAGSIERPSRS